MVQRSEMSDKEKYEMYSALEKDSLIKMLIEANRHLQNIEPKIKFVSGNCGFYNVGMDTSGRCIHCGKQSWEH